MLQNYLLLALRQVIKNRLFIFINILGMATAIACCTVAYYLHDFNETFDGHHANGPSLYRISSIREFQNKLTKYAHAPLALAGALRQNPGDLGKIARYSVGTINTRSGTLLFNESVVYTDPDFFDMFSFEPLYGTLSVQEKASMVISEELAIKYFGSTDAAGQEIVQLLDSGRTRLYTVAGIFRKQPNNTSFNQHAYVNFDNQEGTVPGFDPHSWAARALLYVEVPDARRAQQVEAQLQPYAANNNLAREDFIIQRFALDSFTGLAKSDSYNNTYGVWTNSAAHISAVVGTAAMGIFILLIACFNLTNTAIAVASRRLKEIGIRKVLGGRRKNIIEQYILEVLSICLLALVLGLVIAHFGLIPAFNSLWPFWAITPDYIGKPDFLLFALLILLSTSLLAGSYPAFYISRFQPVQILKGKLRLGGSNGFTLTLLSLQLIISLTAIVCSLAFVANARYQQTLNLGFNAKGVAFASVNSKMEFEALKNRMMVLPEVVSVGSSYHHIGSSYFSDPVKAGGKELEVDILDVGDDYLKTVGITLLEGRDFVRNSETDKHESVIITENMAAAFGWNTALGQEIYWMDTVRYHVVGVARNIVNKGFMSRMDPVMLRYTGDAEARFCVVSAPANTIADVKVMMERELKELFPDRVPAVRYMDELVVNSIRINNSILKMFVFLGILATFLSATGLYTLTSLNIIKRLKEIGMRKVLGASAGNITRIINKEFFVILAIASVLGGYMGASLSGMLLDSIWEHFERTTVLTILSSVAILVATTVLSIGHKVYSTIRINPATVLRSE